MKMTFFPIAILATTTFAFPTPTRGSDKRAITDSNSTFAAGLMINAPANNSFSAVSTNFTVPKISAPKSSAPSDTHNASFWTGLGMQDKLLLEGGNGNLLRVRLIPAKDFPWKAVDIIETVLETFSNDSGNKTMGIVTLRNLLTKKTKSYDPVMNAAPPLLNTCADLVVSGNDKIADFGTVKFDVTEIGAARPFEGGIAGLMNDAERFTLKDPKGKALTETDLMSTNATSSIKIKYVGQ